VPAIRFAGREESEFCEAGKQRWDDPFPRTGRTLVCVILG
jgi:hypothetical protein